MISRKEFWVGMAFRVALYAFLLWLDNRFVGLLDDPKTNIFNAILIAALTFLFFYHTWKDIDRTDWKGDRS